MFSCDPSIISGSTELSSETNDENGMKSYIGKKINKTFNKINNNFLEPVFVGGGRKESKDDDYSLNQKDFNENSYHDKKYQKNLYDISDENAETKNIHSLEHEN